MVFGSIQFGGLASGLDTNAIIQALLAVEAAPIQKLEQQKKAAEKQISLLGTLDGLLQDLKAKAEALATPSAFGGFAVGNPDESLASISISGTPTAGSHSLEVVKLASVDRQAFDGVADPDAALSIGTLSFDYDGTSYSFDNLTGTKSLNDIAAEINSQAGEDVAATVVNTGTSAAPSYRLVIAGKDTGADFQIENALTTIVELGSAEELTDADNAQIILDGLTIDRSDNEFDDVLTGVDITALSADPGNAITFTVAVDTDAIKGKIQDLVGSYNDVIGFINKQNKFTAGGDDEANTVGGPLFGDSVLSSVRSTIFNALFDVDIATVQADTTGFSTLSLLGIDVAVDGTLSIDDAKLDAKMAEDLDAFQELFVDSDGFDNGGAESFEPGFYTDQTADTGLADDLARAIDQLLEPKKQANGKFLDGLLDGRETAINSNIEILNDRIELLQRSLEESEATLIQRFASLEELIGGLNSQGAFLSQQVALGF